MLRELHVRNLAVLAAASVEFGGGFNVLSGETGAGKSLIVDSLSLLAGGRASGELIRTDAETLTVSGVFEPSGDAWKQVVEEAGLEAEGGELLVRREISRSGRNRVFLNDQPTTLRLLADLAPLLLRIHGQREELGLIAPDLQRAWLDRSGGPPAAALLAAAAETFGEYDRLAARLDRLAGDDRLRRERADLLIFQLAELDEARLQAGEEDTLRAERETLRHADAITRGLGAAFALLFEDEGAASERLARAQSQLAAIQEWEPQAGEWTAELEELQIRASEVAGSLRRRLDGLEAEADPARLDAVEQRLVQVERLCRKYGMTTGALLAHREELAAELAELTGDAENREELEARVDAALSRYREVALELSAQRRKWGEELVRRIAAELADLALGRARLEIRLERRAREGSPLRIDGQPVDFGATGIDQVVFYLAANPGEEPRPLAKIASGGELSRIYLALQLAAREEGTAARPTMIFDEVDSGIGGAEAAALGRKLQRLAGGGQILAVTHLPQVASHADRHFKVAKRLDGERTRVEVAALDAKARIDEIARMLAGPEITRISLSHARELIQAAARAS